MYLTSPPSKRNSEYVPDKVLRSVCNFSYTISISIKSQIINNFTEIGVKIIIIGVYTTIYIYLYVFFIQF